MKQKLIDELPDRPNRIGTILKSKEIRSAIAGLSASNELAPSREFAYTSDVITDHLDKRKSPAEDIEFFNTNRVSEAIILEKTRPVLFIKDGLIETAQLKEIEDRIKPSRQELVAPINSVGRIELTDDDTYDWCGTGWRIKDDLIVTNRHVALIFAERQGQIFRFRANQRGRPVRARIDFREEFKGIESEEFGIGEILWIAPDSDAAPDMAVLRIVKDPGLPPPLELADKDAQPGQWIGTVGYPARDSRNDAALMAELFKSTYDVKRFSPGQVVQTDSDEWFLTHDATTLGGNSGSAVIDLANRKVVGLHFGGSFRKTNYAVKASTIKAVLKRSSWVPVDNASLKIPTESFSETTRTVASLKNREGFIENFLDKKVALPTPGASHQVLKTGFSNEALPYMHFSIVMSEARRFPIFTAENLNGALKQTLKRKDAWGYDPRIPKKAQVGHNEFYGPEPFDKGHMVRRENPGWGENLQEAETGENDSFVYTNAIPQMPQLNQKSWLSLEDYVLKNAKTEGFKICVFTGPVFRSGDPAYSGIQVPLDFWKVVVAIDSDSKELLTSAYILSQEGLMPTESFRYGPYKTYQVPVKKIEELADLKFSKAVRDADVFSGSEIEAMTGTGRFLEITSEEDIVLTRQRVQ